MEMIKDELLRLLENAYTPYNNFPVAAIVVTKNNSKFYGVNIENSSFSASICAERSAISNAISSGVKKSDFKTLYVMLGNGEIGTPCFVCRQVIIEFFAEDSKIICFDIKGNCKEYLVKDLCPHPFEYK